MKKNSIVAACLTATAMAHVPAWCFTLNDIHFWGGVEGGTNRMGLVVDWGGTAKAWGYRWNGTCPNLETVLRELVQEDHRFHMGYSVTAYGFYLQFLGYDVSDSHARFNVKGAVSDDSAALVGSDAAGPWWYVFKGVNGQSFQRGKSTFTDIMAGMSDIVPAANDWWLLSFGYTGYDMSTYVGYLIDDPPEPSAAESPYGFRVVSSFTEDEQVYYPDPSLGYVYRNANAVLGRPARMLSFSGGGIVNPFTPAFEPYTLFALDAWDEGDAYVTIEFDHDVVDDPANPWGIDFIVFGNAFCIKEGNASYTPATDPDTVFSSEDGYMEVAKVEVSQDGNTWYAFQNGPYADSFMPTLGHVYDKANPDASLFSGNLWWGAPASAVMPVDPSVTWASCKGLSLGEICRRYNGSAGGTGYDIGRLELPTSPERHGGRKWFRYVRISNMEDPDDLGMLPVAEIDAVADVAPVSSYRRWVCDNFQWGEAYQDERYTAAVYAGKPYATNRTGFSALSANGLANGLNAALGIPPSSTESMEFRVSAFHPATDGCVMEMLSRESMQGKSDLVVVDAKESLTNRQWKAVYPSGATSEFDAGVGLWRNSFSVPASAGRFFRLRISE